MSVVVRLFSTLPSTPAAAAAALIVAFGLVACGSDVERAGEPVRQRPGRVIIHEPETLTSLRTDVTTADGRSVRLRCESCHGLEDLGDALPETADDAGGPHVGLEVAHGDLACAACHAPEEPERIRMADGRVLPMREAMTLCAQCHGPQHRDYRHGSHGGMQGYWDLSRGDRLRNHCVDCHDPHRPAFPTFQPLPPPHDRFQPAPPEEHTHE